MRKIFNKKSIITGLLTMAVLTTSVYALDKNEAFKDLFDNKSQYLDESSTHPQRSAQLNGIKATLVSMAGDEKNAYFVIDFENTNGREFKGNNIAFEQFQIKINRPKFVWFNQNIGVENSGSGMSWRVVNSEDEDFGKKPRLFVVMSENDKIAGETGEIVIENIIEELNPVSLDNLSRSKLDLYKLYTESTANYKQTIVDNSEEIKWANENKEDMYQTEYANNIPSHKLQPRGLDRQMFEDLDGVFIDNIAFVDGKLHIVTRFINQRQSFGPTLSPKVQSKDSSQTDINPIYNIFESASNQDSSYGYYVYDISTPEELKQYDLSGWYSKELNKTQGVWKIPFDANYKVTNKKIKLDEKIKIDDEESIVESVSISPISIELNLNGKNPNNGYVNLKVFDKSGSEIFLSGGSNMSSKTKATYVWTFMEPVDINAINKIAIEGNEIILKN